MGHTPMDRMPTWFPSGHIDSLKRLLHRFYFFYSTCFIHLFVVMAQKSFFFSYFFFSKLCLFLLVGSLSFPLTSFEIEKLLEWLRPLGGLWSIRKLILMIQNYSSLLLCYVIFFYTIHQLSTLTLKLLEHDRIDCKPKPHPHNKNKKKRVTRMMIVPSEVLGSFERPEFFRMDGNLWMLFRTRFFLYFFVDLYHKCLCKVEGKCFEFINATLFWFPI